jgi:hypothetical protein
VVSPTPAPLDAGTPHTLQAARLATSGRLRLPQRLPHPTRVFVLRQNRAVVVTLAYRRADRLRPTPETGYALIVTEIFDAGQPLFEKLLYTNSQAVQVHVHDQVGIFVTGPQEIMNVRGSGPQDGVLYEVSARASANTLIWADQAGTYRLEGNFTRRTAVDLAESFG